MWYYCVDGKVYGPVDDKELKSIADKGIINPLYQVNKQGTTFWTNAGNVKGLFPSELVMHYQDMYTRKEQSRAVLDQLTRYALAAIGILAVTYIFYAVVR